MGNYSNLTSYFTDGYFMDNLFTCTPSVNLTIFDAFNFTDSLNEEDLNIDPFAKELLNDMHQYFAKKWIELIFVDYELKVNGMWSGVDEGSMKWHNDFEDGDPFNSNILVYLNDTDDKENNIQVRTNKGPGTILHPQRGDFVWLNQSSCFEHKASHNSGTRRLLSFEFLISGLS